MSSHYYEPMSFAPSSSSHNGHFALSNKPPSPPVRTKHQISLPKQESPPHPRFRRMDASPAATQRGPGFGKAGGGGLPTYAPNPLPTPPYTKTPPQQYTNRRSQSPRSSQSPANARSPSPIEIAIPPPFGPDSLLVGGGIASHHHHQRSDASSVVPLPATVYVPGEGDEEDGGLLRGERTGRPVYDTPPDSMRESVVEAAGVYVPASPGPGAPRRALSYGGSASQGDLIGLWNAAEGAKGVPGARAGVGGRTYVLNMYRQAPLENPNPVEHTLFFPEHFTFGTTPSTPFYAIHATRETPHSPSFNELTLHRRNPVTGVSTSVITLGLEPPSRRISPGGDGLVTLIYPKQAVLSAMTPTTASPSAAIQKAYSTQCCRLAWSAPRGRYYLYHPGVAESGDAYLVEISGDVGFDHLGARGSIKLISVDADEPLVELDFARNLLFVNTRATEKVPSEFIVDVAVCTVLVVATVEGRRMRVVRRSQSGGSAGSAVGGWGEESGFERSIRGGGGCLSMLSGCFEGLLRKRGRRG